ncbi:helix-turn-helix domain-containing protein [Kosakonia sacchari]|uniref:helix-turn-helix domain-containing protein n=1 Tax=Kosakonia sacchari TaxID=1158459 RepID=UPI002ACD5AD1|nr:helix-turn-helix domain-containing protein [Kosakonia sacchari]MDZ7320723.1 helix-turn-helix domain-containing protein [Kosakonia sacchari]
MSMSLMVQAMKARVGNPLRKLVLIKLADNASDSGECWPAVATIAYECEISSRSVQTHIRQLVKDGFVRVEERRDSSGVNRSNIYHLTFNNEGENPAPYQKQAQKQGAGAAPPGVNGAEWEGAGAAPPGANGAGGEGAGAAPRISQLLDPVKEPKTPLNPPMGNLAKTKFDPLTVELPDWLSRSLWVEWVEYRKALRKPIKTPQGAKGSIRELEKYRSQGIGPELVISHSIAREYQGLYPPNNFNQTQANRSEINAVSQPDSSVPDGFRG